MRIPTRLLLAALATWTATVGPSEGGVAPAAGLGCVPASRPAATLLLPYFELDLGDPAGRNTLFSVNNAASSPRVAHAVVWTNWGVPVLSFDLALPADGVRSINLRSILAAGSIAETSLPPEALADFPGCATPLVVPDLGGASLTELQDRLRGQSDDQGDCVAAPVEGGQVITGFVTIDAARLCARTRSRLKSPAR